MPSTQEKKLLIVGDSLSAAYGLSSGQGWVHLLKERIKDSPWKVINASISGDTTRGGLSRLGGLLAAYQPHIVVIQLGANDYLRRQDPHQMEDNLATMIRACQEAGAVVVLAGLHPPLLVRLMARQMNYDPAPYMAAYRRLAYRHGVGLVRCILKGVLARPGLFLPDRMHPNAQAQPIILENIWRTLQPLLRI